MVGSEVLLMKGVGWARGGVFVLRHKSLDTMHSHHGQEETKEKKKPLSNEVAKLRANPIQPEARQSRTEMSVHMWANYMQSSPQPGHMKSCLPCTGCGSLFPADWPFVLPFHYTRNETMLSLTLCSVEHDGE